MVDSIPVQNFHSDTIHMTAISEKNNLTANHTPILPTALPHVSRICATGRLEFIYKYYNVIHEKYVKQVGNCIA